jgi:cytochrome b6-f complex iron-sulfur subunit
LTDDNSNTQDRREFLNYLIGIGLVALGAVFSYPVIRYIWPSNEDKSGGGGRTEVIAAEELPEGSGMKVVHNDIPVWVVHAPFGFVAVSAVCTHLGCIVEYDADKEIWCPCHAAFFDLRGNVKSGPAPSSLPTFEVAVVDGVVYIEG